MKFQTNKQQKDFAVVLILLSAIFSGAFSLAFYSPNRAKNLEMVYCPLTKQLQPVHAAQIIQTENKLDEICLTDRQKNEFSSAILEKVSFGLSLSKEKSVEDLVFNYFRDGKSALDANPNLPNQPEKTFAKNSFSLIGFGNNFDTQAVWKTEEKFSFQLKPRPPTSAVSIRFEFNPSNDLENISRNINPRSPPVPVV